MRGIRRLKSGKYQARYFAGFDSKGKRIYPSQSFLRQADAIKWRNGKLHEKENGLSVDSLALTMGAFLTRWLETRKERSRPNSWRVWDAYVRLYIRPVFESKNLRVIQPIHVERWQSELRARVSGRTVNESRRILARVFRYAIKLKLVALNPVEQTDPMKHERKEMKVLTPEQANRLLESCSDDRWGLFFMVMLNTGIRPSEGQGLKWARLELESGREGRLKVREALTTLGVDKPTLFPPKSKKSERDIAFPPSLVSRFLDHRRRQLEERLAAGSAYEQNDFVFANPIGQPLNRSELHRRFKVTLERAGLPNVRLYDLRHTFCTLSLAAGIDLKTVSADMGHASVAFTLDHYGHVLDSMRESAAAKREEMFGKSNARR